MINPLRISCSEVMDELFEFREEEIPLLLQLKIGCHLIFCARCSGEAKKMEMARELLRTGFFPASPSLEEEVMEKISEDTSREDVLYDPEVHDIYGGFSFRSWVIVGIFILISLVTCFFGMDFIELESSQGSSFLLPLAITVGTVLTGYGAFFIGSHLKEIKSHLKHR